MKLASIERIKSVAHHSNADTLDVVHVLGYQCIVKRDQFQAGQLVVLIQPDVVLPNAPWTTLYKAKSNRVKAIRLRQVWSMGIVEPITLLMTHISQQLPAEQTVAFNEGQEVSEILGITKYEPPLPQDINAKGHLPYGLTKTDEERWQNIPDLPWGAIVDVTLKIDGSSLTVYYKNGDVGVTTRTMDLKLDSSSHYTNIVRDSILPSVKSYCETNKKNLAFRGEMYGKGIQSFKGNPHCEKPLSFALFEVMDLDTLQSQGTESELYFEKIGKALNIETVPILEKGVVLTPELIKKYEKDLETINGQPFEGVVINLPDGTSFKVINFAYDSRK